MTGYRGRLALAEFWEPDDGARALIEAGAPTEALLRQALGAGMQPLVHDALDKAIAGRTTFEELRNVVPYEQIVRHLHAASAPRTSFSPSAALLPG
jgi:type II secretory ATPase GspE/PulE/Tfp pilus assembly ATPase PilB-like protein